MDTYKYTNDVHLPVWRDRVRRFATAPVVIRSSPATGHIP